MISLISDVHNIMRDSLVCKTTHARITSTDRVQKSEWKESTDCVVLTVALVINPFHICLLC